MKWYKLKNTRINLEMIKWYQPLDDNEIEFNFDVIRFDSQEDRDKELKKLDETLEKGLHTIQDFKY